MSGSFLDIIVKAKCTLAHIASFFVRLERVDPSDSVSGDVQIRTAASGAKG